MIVENGAFDLWYSHWSANSLDRDLFWGPDWALPFIRRQEPAEEWLDDIWCEGAALVDLDEKAMLLFGGEDILYDSPLRRVYLELLACVWSGWTIRWAFEGLVDIAEYVGVDRRVVLAAKERPLGTPPGPADNRPRSVASVRWEDGQIGAYAMNCEADYLVRYGAGLVDVLRRIARRPGIFGFLRRRSTQESLIVNANCSGGVHLDLRSRTIDFWLTQPRPDQLEKAKRRWPEWNVHWHRDSFEDHCALTEHKLNFEIEPDRALLENVIKILDSYSERHRGQQAREAAAVISKHEVKTVEISPAALIDAPQSVPAEVRQRILHGAMTTFLGRR